MSEVTECTTVDQRILQGLVGVAGRVVPYTTAGVWIEVQLHPSHKVQHRLLPRFHAHSAHYLTRKNVHAFGTQKG